MKHLICLKKNDDNNKKHEVKVCFCVDSCIKSMHIVLLVCCCFFTKITKSFIYF